MCFHHHAVLPKRMEPSDHLSHLKPWAKTTLSSPKLFLSSIFLSQPNGKYLYAHCPYARWVSVRWERKKTTVNHMLIYLRKMYLLGKNCFKKHCLLMMFVFFLFSLFLFVHFCLVLFRFCFWFCEKEFHSVNFVAQAGFKLIAILLPQSPKYQDHNMYRPAQLQS